MVPGFRLFNRVADSRKNEIKLDLADSPQVEKKQEKKSGSEDDPFQSLYETKEEKRARRHGKIKHYKSKINEYRAKARAAKEAYHGFLNEPEMQAFRTRIKKANQEEYTGFDFSIDLGLDNRRRRTAHHRKQHRSNDPFDFSDILG